MIDLRSDTFTVPDQGMREVMAMAAVGDDVYGEDPSITMLQDRMAAMFGKEAALFVPSGTMGNQICLALHGGPGDEVIAEADAHIFHYENGAASTIARVQLHPIPSESGAMPLDKVEDAIRPSAYYYPRTTLIAVENSHNRHGGTVLSLQYLYTLQGLASRNGIALHCDGARIWNACVTNTCTYKEIAAVFDTMSVCLSKGLGAPVGSVILGSQAHIDVARRWRKMLGGGMRQAGVLAAAALYALDKLLERIPDDHRHALGFAKELATIPGVTVDLDRVQTNIVRFSVPMEDSEFISAMAKQGVAIAPIAKGLMRAVFYHQISEENMLAAVQILRSVVSKSN